MTRDQLLERANRVSAVRYQVPVSRRALRLWVQSGLVPGPAALGQGRGRPPRREWPLLAYRRVLQICRLKSQGVTTRSDQTVALFLAGARLSFASVQKGVKDRISRDLREIGRARPTGWDPNATQPTGARMRRAVLKKLVAPHGDIEVSETLAAPLYRMTELLFRDASQEDAVGIVLAWLRASHLLAVELPLSDMVSGQLVTPLVGVLADSDESNRSALDSVSNADEVSLRSAQVFAWHLRELILEIVNPRTGLFSPESSGVPIASAQVESLLKSFRGRLILFVASLRLLGPTADSGAAGAAFAREVMPVVCRFIRRTRDDVGIQEEVARLTGSGSPFLALTKGAELMESEANSEQAKAWSALVERIVRLE